MKKIFANCVFVFLLMHSLPTSAHHVLGRPAYSLNENSNTPPSMQVETQIGNYYVTFMAFPAFPKPNEQGRVNLYASRIDNGAPFQGEVTFKVRYDRLFSGKQEILGIQKVDDNVYRQGFLFKEAGDYIVTAEFQADGEPYVIEFPLRIGDPAPVGPLGITVAVLLIVLIGVNIINHKRRHQLMAKQQRGNNQ